jgi:hypothetical protein
MKQILLSLAFSLTLILDLSAQYKSENLKLAQVTGSDKYVYQHLLLYPIRANRAFLEAHKNLTKYVTLEQALKAKKVLITEQSNGGNVNSLLFENTSKDTVMLLSGEVVQGGKQDRVIGQDVILYPHTGKKKVDVFCVEHGRWSPKNSDSSFKDYYNLSSNEVRKAATVKKNQQEVWSKVAETTAKNSVNTSTGTLTALQQSEKLSGELKKYKDHFQGTLSSDQEIIGLVAVSGNNILGCDMFATHEVFQQYLSNLLSSYATEAITSGSKPAVSYTQAEQYLMSIISDENKQDKEVEKKGTILKDGNKKVHISTF